MLKQSSTYSTESPSVLTNGEESTDSIISKNAFKFILPCLQPIECNVKNGMCVFISKVRLSDK
jgi:hypothetical protein